MKTDLIALWDAQIKIDKGRAEGVADWIIALESSCGPALRRRGAPMTIRLFAAQNRVFLAIHNDDQVSGEMIEEVIAASAEARREIEED